jgi:hypothetical protein
MTEDETSTHDLLTGGQYNNHSLFPGSGLTASEVAVPKYKQEEQKEEMKDWLEHLQHKQDQPPEDGGHAWTELDSPNEDLGRVVEPQLHAGAVNFGKYIKKNKMLNILFK